MRFKKYFTYIFIGAAQWNGEYAVWYKKEWMIYRTSKREEFVKYSWDEKLSRFSPVDKPHLSSWDSKIGSFLCVPSKPEISSSYAVWSYKSEDIHPILPLMLQMVSIFF